MYVPPPAPPAQLPEGIKPVVDDSKRTTMVRITLYTGQTSTLTVNPETHTVADIHTYVMSVAPTVGSY